MDITAMTVVFFLLGSGIGYPVMVFAKNRGPIPWLLIPLIGYSIPLFTIGPHPIVLGLYLPLAGYLLYCGWMVIRNPSAINEFWLNFGNKDKKPKDGHRMNPFGMTDYEWAHFDDDWMEDDFDE